MKNEILNNLNYKKIIMGNAVLFANKIIFSSLKNYTERSTVSGENCITNRALKSIKVTLDAFMHIKDDYENNVIYLLNALKNNERFDVEIGNFIFPDSEIILLKCSESTESGFVSCVLTIVSEKNVKLK